MLKTRPISKYDSYHFWENLIQKEASMWMNGFQNKPLTPDSIFIYTVLMDHQKGYLKSRWAYYPDVYSLLGFLQYVFLPTAFFSWLDREVEGFNVPLATGEQVLRVMAELEPDLNSALLEIMATQLERIKGLWEFSPLECLQRLQSFSADFNHCWQESAGKLVYFKIFESPEEIGEYVLRGGELDTPLEVMEEEINLTKAQWEAVYQNVLSDPFMRKKFIDILNYQIGCLV